MCEIGSDFTRKLPRVGPKTLWENLHILIPLMTLCIQSREDNTLEINPVQFVDIVLSNIYREVFAKHIREEKDDYALIYDDLLHSKLADITKNEIMTREELVCNMKNIQWVLEYWQKKNCQAQRQKA